MAKNKNSVKEISAKEIIVDFLKTLEIDVVPEVTETEDEIQVVLDTDEGGLIIGYHGETLESLQLVIALIIAKKTGVFKRVSVEVGDYKKNREEWLRNLAIDTKQKVLEQQREYQLSDLKSWERRIIHLILQDDKEVDTESVGEGRDRVLIVRPK